MPLARGGPLAPRSDQGAVPPGGSCGRIWIMPESLIRVSVGIEDIAPQDWTAKVYKPDIIQKRDTLYKNPGYNPL